MVKNPVLRTRPLVPAWVATLIAATITFLCTFEFGRTPTLKMARAWQIDQLVLIGIGFLVVVLAAIEQRAEFGAEGLRIGRFLYRRTIAYRDIRQAVPTGQKAVTILTLDGRSFMLSAGYLDESSARDVLERVWESIAAGSREGARGAEKETLARSGRTTADWRKALRSLAGGGYRSAQFSPDRLVAIAENPGITPDLRSAAIVALSTANIDAATRARFQAAAEVTVDPSLRALLEKAGAGDLSEHDCDAALDAI